MQLEELIYQLDDDLEIAKIIKKEIKNYLEQVKITGGKDFFVKHTKKMDYFINLIYKYVLKKAFLNFKPPINNIPISIIALGSYGREQLSIFSDIDIMIVYKEVKGYNLKEIIENFITLLWDLGLHIGHRVHEIKDLFPASNEDITIKTAILESRFICGSKFLWYECENELNKIRNHNKKEYILAKYEEMKNRHKKYPISMEPNIKDGFGGIRDSNTLLWISKVIFNYPNTSYLVPKYATEEEYKEYRSSLEFLFKTRVFLHLVAKKKVDTVYLEYQRDIALKMGYTDSTRLKAERRFIRDLLKALWTVNTFSELKIKKLIKPYLFKDLSIKKKREKPYFYICNEKLFTKFETPLSFKEYLKEILDLSFKETDISVINNFKNKKFSITKTLIKKLFFTNSIYPLFMALYRANKLEKIFPFEKIKYLAQFDGYHQYPVDIHSLNILKELENINEFQNLNEKEKALLRFACFFHDLGKGRMEEHSIIGAKIAKEFAQKINFHQIETIEKLIKYHTLMSNTAFREDIFNDKVILSFAQIVQNKDFLKYLYILTIADIKAVGKGVFNSYKEYLLKTLYNNTLYALENKELINEIAIRKRKEKQLLKINPPLLKEILSSPSNQLFLQNSTNEIIKLLEWIKDVKDKKIKFENEKFLIIHIAKKNLNLSLGWLIEKLQNYELNHLSIYKIGDIKYFKITFSKKANEYDLYYIKEIIEEAFKNKQIQNKIKFKKEEFEIDCNHSINYASLKLTKEDKKGIISTIMDIFDKFEISIEDVKISSQKNIARDLFIIPKSTNFCEKKEKILKELTK